MNAAAPEHETTKNWKNTMKMFSVFYRKMFDSSSDVGLLQEDTDVKREPENQRLEFIQVWLCFQLIFTPLTSSNGSVLSNL